MMSPVLQHRLKINSIGRLLHAALKRTQTGFIGQGDTEGQLVTGHFLASCLQQQEGTNLRHED